MGSWTRTLDRACCALPTGRILPIPTSLGDTQGISNRNGKLRLFRLITTVLALDFHGLVKGKIVFPLFLTLQGKNKGRKKNVNIMGEKKYWQIYCFSFSFSFSLLSIPLLTFSSFLLPKNFRCNSSSWKIYGSTMAQLSKTK